MPKTNSELRQKRDEALYKRFRYWSEVQRLRFDDTIKRLSEKEFFISESYVIQIIHRENEKAIARGERVPRQKYLSVNLD